MSRASKLRRKHRKVVSRVLMTLRRNLFTVAVAYAKDLVWNRTPDVTATCIEVMLITIAQEFEQWPDDWPHRHHFWNDGACSCGRRMSVIFDGESEVLELVPVERVYHLTRDLKLDHVTIDHGVTVFTDGHHLFPNELVRRGRLASTRSIRLTNGTYVDLGERPHQPLWDTVVRVHGDDAEESVNIERMLEMGPPQG